MGRIRTCGDINCKKTQRRMSSRQQLLKHGSPSSKPEVAAKISAKTKQAFKDGRMDHLKHVYQKNAENWAEQRKKKNTYHMIWVDGKQRPEHCVKMEKKIGRPLQSHEIVHHKNGKKWDNRMSNLQLMTISEHVRYHQLKDNSNNYRK